MNNNKENSLCCGGGSGGPWKKHLHEQTFGKLRIQEAINTGADIIATACPYCILMLNDAIVSLAVQDKIKVQDISELLLTSVEFSNKTKTTISNTINSTISEEEDIIKHISPPVTY
jgi:Fe-S oxidoreductase